MAEEDTPQPRNRKERRAAAKSSNQPLAPPSSFPKLKMTQPDRSRPQGKTLLDLYDERKTLLDHGKPFDLPTPNASFDPSALNAENGNTSILEAGLGPEDPIGPVGQAFFWAVSLGMFHFMLDALTYQQYQQEFKWRPLFDRFGMVVPVLWVLLYLTRREEAMRLGRVRQGMFFVGAVAAGCYTIFVGNEFGYWAVMKRVPPLATLWCWSVIELDLVWAVPSLVICAAYLWVKGYGSF